MGADQVEDFADRAIRDLLAQPANLREVLFATVPDLAADFDVELTE